MRIKAIFHIDETEKWKLAIGNVRNLLKGLENEPFDLEILANSAAVAEYRRAGGAYSTELKELSDAGVRLCACRNALNGLSITPEELLDFVEVVPIGVKELIEKQLAGFAYVKP